MYGNSIIWAREEFRGSDAAFVSDVNRSGAMPFKPSDIERAAMSLIRDYGHRAADRAAESAREAREAGNATSAGLWSLIEREIRRQQSVDTMR